MSAQAARAQQVPRTSPPTPRSMEHHVARLRKAVRALIRHWETVQIELHGQYSLARLDELLTFTRRTSTPRAIGILLLTPLACVVLIILPDLLPLRPPADGVFHQSATYWVRMFFTSAVSSAITMLQIWHASPRLPLVKAQFAIAAVLCGIGGILGIFVVHLLIGFPTPFVTQTSSFIGFSCLVGSIWAMWRTQISEDPEVKRDLWQYRWLCASEFTMMVVYPVMIWVFGMLNGHQQTAFALTFPVVKLIFKNIASRGLYRLEDLAPVYVVLGVDAFHALLLSCAMRSAISSGTLISIMAIDICQSVVAVVEVRAIIQRFEKLRLEILTVDTATAVMCHLHQPTSAVCFASFLLESYGHLRTNPAIAAPRHLRPPRAPMAPSRIAPVTLAITPQRAVLISDHAPQVKYVWLSLRLLHMVEFYMLIEFTEVIVAVIYAIYLTAMFHLPNRVYYTTLKTLTRDQVMATVNRVLEYAALELLSLMALGIVLDRLLGVSTLRLLAFALRKHAVLVQSLLVFWVMTTTQLTLEHLGNDYTFRFQWLRHPESSADNTRAT